MRKYVLLITTSHKPSPRTRSFAKDLSNTLPASLKVNRGKKTLAELGLEAHRFGANYVFVVGEKKGNPTLIRVYRVEKTGKYPVLKQLYSVLLKGVKLTRENPESSRVYNPETVNVDYDKCVSDRCYRLADAFNMIYADRVVVEPDVLLRLSEKRYVVVEPLNRHGRVCGPILRVRDVRVR